MIAELRERLELQRREKVHRQIGALTAKLDAMARRHDPREGSKFYRLLNKKKRLEFQLRQPMLFYRSRHGGSPFET